MSVLQILAIYRPLFPSLYGNHLNVILIWKYFLIQFESDVFKAIDLSLGYSNFSREEWDVIRALADDRNIVTQRTDKASCVVIRNRKEYVKEAEI